ncbi:putative MFS-type transporter YusP [Achaetomium macrosporum]|uniref:MFS-type transporter YusP n=1 Tax=Achaetomium macrosporum TaxID=79813 RepID=A0AAN7H661_9PEZI|nr:putative MFS-type transporter YusP [Achaetomium macrosporum]
MAEKDMVAVTAPESAPESAQELSAEKDTIAVPAPELTEAEPASPKGLQFWLVFVALCLAGFLSATDASIIVTALPTISNDLGGQAQYIWLGNAYVFAGIAGGAHTPAMFISGRLLQGLGGGGMVMLIDLIVCDLLPLRERSAYLGTVLGACAVGTLVGPVIGGALVSRASWRWAFWINLPVCALTLAAMAVFLRVSWQRSPSWTHALARIDYLGNTIFVGSITSILIALVQGGVVYPWGAWQTILPLVIGFAGWGAFFVQQAFCKEPTMPLRLFAHRTSASVSLQNFIVSVLLEWCIYVLPLYFQAQLAASALDSGLDILPINAFMIPSGAVAGALLTKIGRYKPLHWGGFAVLAVSASLFSTMSASTSTVAWAWFEILAGIGIGFPLTTQLPAIQAVLPESDTAISTSTYSFIRSFGFVWGATIPSIIFNDRVDAALGSIDDPNVRAALAHGGAYSYALEVRKLTGTTLQQTLDVYAEALRAVWFGGLAFALVGFLLVFVEKHVDLRVTLETEFGLEKENRPERITTADKLENIA